MPFKANADHCHHIPKQHHRVTNSAAYNAPLLQPGRSSAVPSDIAHTLPTMRDRHLPITTKHGRMGWQKASGYNWRALVKADISCFKPVIGDGLRSRTDRRRTSEVGIATKH